MEKLLPKYPEITSNDFYYDIYRKKEFYELRDLEKTQFFYNHQLIISRFISHWTLYQSLFLIHETGTGKTGAAAAVFDGLKYNRPKLKTLYVVQNDTLLENFRSKFFYLSRYIQEKVEKEDWEKGSTHFKRNQLLRDSGIHVSSYYELAKSIQSDPHYLCQWNNHLLIFDEVHHLVTEEDLKKDEKKLQKYEVILNAIQKLTYKKLLLMTATPMRNSPEEISYLFNLMLPKEESFPTGSDFITEYFRSEPSDSGIPIYHWLPGKQEKFQIKVKGYVSVLKQFVDVQVAPQGKIYPPMEYYKLCVYPMKEIQNKGYSIAYKNDTKSTTEKGTGIYNHSKQASLFVFPDQTIGESKKYLKTIIKTKIINDAMKKEEGKFPALSELFIKESKMKPFTAKRLDRLTDNDIQQLKDNCKQLENYSVTYASIIQKMLTNRDQQMYIYCELIQGSGIKVFISLLRQFFGYKMFHHNALPKDQDYFPRFIFLHDTETDEEATKGKIHTMIDFFNSSKNLQGKLVQVIIGTNKTREGISFRRIEQIHIATPDWNFGKIFQAIGRGIRLDSHQELPPGTRVELFFHCAVPQKHNTSPKKNDLDFDTSIDFYRYYRSEFRDRNIKKIEYSLLIASIDCHLNKSRNDFGVRYKDFSADCYYQKCDFTCLGKIHHPPDIDFSTYDLFYTNVFSQKTESFIQNLFQDRQIYSLEEIMKKAELLNLRLDQIVHTLSNFIDTPIPIRLQNTNREFFLNFYNDVFYVTEERVQYFYDEKKQLWLSEYSHQPVFVLPSEFSSIYDRLSEFNIQKLCRAIQQCILDKRPKKAIEIFDLFSDRIQAEFLHLLLLHPDHPRSKSYLALFESILYKNNKNEWVWVKKDAPVRKLKQGSWVLQKEETILPKKQIKYQNHEDPAFVEKYVKDKNFYGFMEDDKFKIRDVRNSESFINKKTTTTGKTCKNYNFYELYYIIYLIDPEFNTAFPWMDKDYKTLKKIKSTDSMDDLFKQYRTARENLAYYKLLLKSMEKNDETQLTKKDLQFLILCMKLLRNKDKICSYLKNLFEKKGIMVLPPLPRIKEQPKEPKKRGRKPKNIFDINPKQNKSEKPPSSSSSIGGSSSTSLDIDDFMDSLLQD